jgi:4-amino-4-deoxy-L-arabinose transferase-like glycosyltransferase
MPSASIPKRPLATTLTLLVLWIVFYASFTLFTPALLDDADSVHAEVAREMLLRHDYVTLYANSIRYLEKAPLLYWSMAAWMQFARFFGYGTANALAVAARIPLALTVLALAFAVEGFARRAFSSPEQQKTGSRAGLYAALILLSSPGIFLFTRILLPDAMVCLWLTLAMLCFWLTEKSHQKERDKEKAHVPHSSRSDEWDLQSPLLPCFGFAGCCALNVLTKGLIGIVFPIAIVAIYLLLTRGLRGALRRIRQLHPLSSLAVCLAIAAPWHILIALANPTQGAPGGLSFRDGHWQVPLPSDGNVHGWAWFYFVNEQVLRYLNLRVPRDYDTVPLWLFWGLCLIWLMPWSAFLFKAVADAYRRARAAYPTSSAIRHPGRSLAVSQTQSKDPEELSPAPKIGDILPNRFVPGPDLLLIVWAAIPLLFFSFSTRQEYYVLPSLPALVLLIAAWLADRSDTKVAARAHRAAAFNCISVLAAFGLCFALLSIHLIRHSPPPTPGVDLAALLQQNPGDYAMSMGHFLDLNARALSLFRVPLAVAALCLLVGPLLALVLRRRETSNNPLRRFFLFMTLRRLGKPFTAWTGRKRYVHAANLVLAAGAFGFLLAAHLGLQTFAPVLSSQRLAADLASQIQPNDLVVIHQEYEYGSTLGFYLQRPSYRFIGFRLSAPQTTPPTDQDTADVTIRAIAVNPIHILTDASYNGTANYGRSSNLWYGSFFPDAPSIFETPQSLAAKWHGTQRIFLWQDLSNQPSPLPAALSPAYVIAKSGGKEIVSNQPCPTCVSPSGGP